jgi:predicted acylesterase/phospholipase RssA
VKRPLSLVLGSGGARGLCFIGALRALDEAGLQPSHVVGSSMGALLGAGYCSGKSPAALAGSVGDFSLRRILCPDPLGPGVLEPSGLRIIATRLIDAKNFADLRIPLTVVCTDLQTGSAVCFCSGPLLPPVVGSCLTAGVFTPIRHEGRYLVDGGYTDPVPVAAAPSESIVVAVDPSAIPDWSVDLEPLHSWKNIAKLGKVARQVRKSVDALIFALGRERLRLREHILVVPALGPMTFLDFNRGEWAIERGYEAMKASIPSVMAKIETPL